MTRAYEPASCVSPSRPAPPPRHLSGRVIDFSKMHGLGNDFVVIDATARALELSADDIRYIADRHFGIGCDQVLLVERPRAANADFRYRIFNADGGEVEQCGNGVRCFARFVLDRRLTSKTEIVVETSAGLVFPRIEADGQVTVNMGVPDFAPRDIPFLAEREASQYPLDVAGRTLMIGAVSLGNPHAVLRVSDAATAEVAELGPLIERHPRFPRRVNAGFMEVAGTKHIRLRVYERGAGETLACGTGACAAVAVGRLNGWLDEEVEVELPGGSLTIRWAGGGAPVWMTGPATAVYEGKIPL